MRVEVNVPVYLMGHNDADTINRAVEFVERHLPESFNGRCSVFDDGSIEDASETHPDVSGLTADVGDAPKEYDTSGPMVGAHTTPDCLCPRCK